MRARLFDDEIEELELFGPADGDGAREGAALHGLSVLALTRRRRARCAGRWRRSWRELAGRTGELEKAGRALGGPAPEPADAVRPGEDGGDRDLQGDRELLALPVGAGGPASRRRRCSTTCRRTGCCSSTRATSRSLRSGRCSRATARARRPWWNTASACRRRWTTGRLRFEEFDGLRPQTVYVSATPADFELQRRAGGGGDGGAADGAGGPRGGGAAGGQPGGRPAVGGPRGAAAGERTLVTTLTKRMAEQLTEYLVEHGVKRRTCTRTSTRWSGPRSSTSCAAAAVDVLVGSTCCARAWTCRRWRWWRCWTRTRRAFCARSAR